MRTTVRLSILGVLPFLLAACDNFVRGFDPGYTPGGNTTASAIELVPEGGDARDGRPFVKNTWPKGGGWPTTVPVVVEFSESMSEGSVAPTTNGGNDGTVVVRVKGTTQAVPAFYDFVLGGRVLIMRPTTGLANVPGQAYEVVLLPNARDVDGLGVQVTTELILAEFQVDQDSAVEDGQVVAVLPRDNQTEVSRETLHYVVFDKPATTSTVTSSSYYLARSGGTAVAGSFSTPLRVANQADPRVFRMTSDAALAAGTQFGLYLDDTIGFGQAGKLDFGNKTPYARFTTVDPEMPTDVVVGNPTTGFDNQINRSNVQALTLHVSLPASALAGDRLQVRIYGLDNDTTATDDIKFVERIATVAVNGPTTATVDFGAELGTPTAPKLGDGEVAFAAQLVRGTQRTGFRLNSTTTAPGFDMTPPTLVSIGPPTLTGSNDAITDQQSIVVHGTASEALAEAALTDGSSTVGLFAGGNDGRFLLQPLLLGRRTTALPYTLTITDRAGNMASGAITGNLLQRGVVTGSNTAGVTVEVYDESTLLVIPGATVLVEAGTPTMPGTGQTVDVTGADGRANFSVTGTTTVTVVAAGYHLRTLYGTGASFVSLPLEPQADATASFTGTANFAQAAGMTALVGNNTFSSPLVLAAQTQLASPTAIPSTAILPNRPQVVTALAGGFEPIGVPTFSSFACQMAGTDLTTPTPPAAPATPGGTSSVSLVLAPTALTIANLAVVYGTDFSLATGLDTGTLVGGAPIVRGTMSLLGFGGQALMGVGFASSTGSGAYTINGSYSLGSIAALDAFAPVCWMVTDARDGAGAVSRHRALLVAATGLTLNLLAPLAVPTVVAPSGPSTGSPQVTIADRLDAATLPAGLGFAELQAQDSAGRQWTLWYEDTDGTGTDVLQFPDLSTVSLTGLATGTWAVRAEARLYLSTTFAAGDIVLEERRRQEVVYARSPTVNFTVQ